MLKKWLARLQAVFAANKKSGLTVLRTVTLMYLDATKDDVLKAITARMKPFKVISRGNSESLRLRKQAILVQGNPAEIGTMAKELGKTPGIIACDDHEGKTWSHTKETCFAITTLVPETGVRPLMNVPDYLLLWLRPVLWTHTLSGGEGVKVWTVSVIVLARECNKVKQKVTEWTAGKMKIRGQVEIDLSPKARLITTFLEGDKKRIDSIVKALPNVSGVYSATLLEESEPSPFEASPEIFTHAVTMMVANTEGQDGVFETFVRRIVRHYAVALREPVTFE